MRFEAAWTFDENLAESFRTTAPGQQGLAVTEIVERFQGIQTFESFESEGVV